MPYTTSPTVCRRQGVHVHRNDAVAAGFRSRDGTPLRTRRSGERTTAARPRCPQDDNPAGGGRVALQLEQRLVASGLVRSGPMR
jgi:hypothetical protein